MEFLETCKTPEGCNPFMWICKYSDGTYVPEFKDKDNETSFLDIEKENVDELHLIGNGFHAMFNTKDGKFIFNDKTKIDFALITEEGKKKDITDDNDYHDIIQYKGFFTDGVSNLENGANLQCHTCSFHIGWKKQFNINEEINIFFKVILSVVMGQGIKLELKLSSNNDFKGDFIITINGPDEKAEAFYRKLDLKKNKSCNFNINLSE